MTRYVSKARLACAGALMLALGACEQRDRGPVDAPQPASLASLDAAAALPYAPPAPVGRYAPAEGYRYAERAYAVQRAVYDTPPDYGFAYEDDRPLVWETADDYAVYAEPYEDSYLTYYYEPGADYPYFVRDGEYGYGYDRGGVLVTVIDARGRYLPADDFRRVAPAAGRYFAHARELRLASRRAERIRLDDQTWRRDAPRVAASAAPLLTAARDDRDWRRWREADHSRELDRFAAEQARRANLARAQVADTERRDSLSSRFTPAPDLREADRRDRQQAFAARQAAEAQAQQQRLAQANAAADHAREAAERAQDRARMQAAQDRRAQADQARAEADRRQAQQAELRQRHDLQQAQQAELRQRHDLQQAQQQAREEARRRDQVQQQQARQQADQAHAREQAMAIQAQAHQQRDLNQQAQAAQARDQARQQHEQAQAQMAQAREQARQQREAQGPGRAAEQQARQAAAHERAQPQGQQPAQDEKGKGRRKKDDRPD